MSNDDTTAQCFAPVAAADARVLVLGSMPGRASLRVAEYYAHPRNAFWPIMDTVFGIATTLPYRQRLQQLGAHRVALWDVLASCTRLGSLDADIDPASIVVNDFAQFFDAHPSIERVCFNGATAEHCFRRHAMTTVPARTVSYLRLPSTSPAHAGLTLAEKTAVWREALTTASEVTERR